MSRETKTTTTITCDFCNGTVYQEPVSIHRVTLGYRPIEAIGVEIRFSGFGDQRPVDICRQCASKAMAKLLEEWK